MFSNALWLFLVSLAVKPQSYVHLRFGIVFVERCTNNKHFIGNPFFRRDEDAWQEGTWTSHAWKHQGEDVSWKTAKHDTWKGERDQRDDERNPHTQSSSSKRKLDMTANTDGPQNQNQNQSESESLIDKPA
jgi:hypothetical protein